MNNYRAATGLSGSRLGLLAKSPRHYKHEADNPKEPTEAMVFGSLCHAMILEPATLARDYYRLPESLTRRAGKDYEMLLTHAGDRVTIKHADWLEAEAIARSVRECPEANAVLSTPGVAFEQEYYWTESGVQCKGKPDIVLPGYVVVDYKTTRDASPDGFKWTVRDKGYLLQLAHYQAAVRQATGREDYPAVLIIAQENEAPYVTQVYSVSQLDINEAHAKRAELLQVYAECMRSGNWSRGYASGIINI